MTNHTLCRTVSASTHRRKLAIESLEQRRLLAADFAFEASTPLPTGLQPFDLIADDLDGDGDLDLVTANQCADDPYVPGHCPGSAYAVSVILNNGNGTFAPEVRSEVSGGFPQGVAVADLNRDGMRDLVVTSPGADHVSVLLGQDNGIFVEAGAYFAFSGPRSIVAGDFDGDGTTDVVVTNMIGEYTPGDVVTVLWGKDDGTFDFPVEVPAGPEAVGIAAGDIDNDGDPDVITANGRGSISVIRDNGLRSFQSPDEYPVRTRTPTEVSVADLNGDGHLDVVASGSQVSVLLGTGDGEGTLSRAMRYGTRNPNASSSPHPHLSYMGVGAADLDRDGDADIVAIDVDVGRIIALSNDGEGRFPDETMTRISRAPWVLAMGDFDRDGDADVAVADNGRSDIVVYFNTTEPPVDGDADGNGQVDFSDFLKLSSNYGKEADAAFADGDFDGDGDVDFADFLKMSNNFGQG